jgi:TRAP-type C4-dicarboxylate transport system permease small subunit
MVDELIDEGKEIRHPLDDRFRKTVWWQIYLPIILFVVLFAILAAVLWSSRTGTASSWGDVSLVLLSVPAAILGLILLLILVGCAVAITYLIRFLPDPFRRLQEILDQVFETTEKVSKMVTKPVMVPSAAGAAIRAVFVGIISIFKRKAM